jgi:hypothetical protein
MRWMQPNTQLCITHVRSACMEATKRAAASQATKRDAQHAWPSACFCLAIPTLALASRAVIWMQATKHVLYFSWSVRLLHKSLLHPARYLLSSKLVFKPTWTYVESAHPWGTWLYMFYKSLIQTNSTWASRRHHTWFRRLTHLFCLLCIFLYELKSWEWLVEACYFERETCMTLDTCGHGTAHGYEI